MVATNGIGWMAMPADLLKFYIYSSILADVIVYDNNNESHRAIIYK